MVEHIYTGLQEGHPPLHGHNGLRRVVFLHDNCRRHQLLGDEKTEQFHKRADLFLGKPDLLARIRNAQMRNHSKVSSPASRLRVSVLDVLKNEGYIRGYASVEHKDGTSELEIELKYFDGAPVIREIARVSKPGRRVYASVKNLPRINNGLGVAIVSTPKGVMADHDAREANVGGEVLCTVF